MERIVPGALVAAGFDGDAGTYAYDATIAAALAASVPASEAVMSSLLPAGGLPNLAVAVTSTEAGTLTVQRYLDSGGTIALDGGQSVSLTANDPATLNINDGKPWQSYTVSVSNSSGSTAATLSNVIVLQQSR